MNWHYTVGTERRGPVDEAALRAMIASGEIARDALVWNEILPDWIPVAQIAPTVVPAPKAATRDAVPTMFRRIFFWLLIGRVALSISFRLALGLGLGNTQFFFYGVFIITVVVAWLAFNEQRKYPVRGLGAFILAPIGLMVLGFATSLLLRGGLNFSDGIPLWFQFYMAYGYLALGINLLCAVLGLMQLRKQA